MTTIYKFDVPIQDAPILHRIPVFSDMLCVQVQNGTPRIWVRLETNDLAEARDHEFRWFATGGDAPEHQRSKYIGTVQLLDGALVFHLFEVIR